MIRSPEAELKIDIAAGSEAMVDFFRLRMLDDPDIDPERATLLDDYDEKQFDAETKYIYGLGPAELITAKVRCIGKIAGIRTVRELLCDG